MKTKFLVALDWGTSNLRATLLDSAGSPLEARATAGGVMTVQAGRFAEVLASLCGDWMQRFDCSFIASGMIGSRQGWCETPYLDCPASSVQAAQALVQVDLSPRTGVEGHLPGALHIIPGLRCLESNGQYDVMRGEETQIWGAALVPGSVCVLPGTHSKWAWLGASGEVAGFRTYMTGELYGLLTKHSILGRLMENGPRSTDAFVRGVRIGVDSHAHATHAIFSARTAGLMQSIPPTGLSDYLSGVLIGLELGSALAGLNVSQPRNFVLIGDDDLCWRYELAFELMGMPTARASENATISGQFMIARAAGLVGANL